MRYLPNKKFFLITVIILLIIGGGFFILKNDDSGKHQQSAEQQLSLDSEPVIAQEIDKDSDSDGLKDWEEALWKTDPNNPDTDKDGTSDGQEIKENRNSLVAGNGKTDKIQGLNPEKPATKQITQSPPNLTEAIGQEFLSAYLSSTQGGGETLNSSDKKNLADYLSGAVQNFGEMKTDYLKTDIKIAARDDQDAVKEYGNDLALIIKKYFDPIDGGELEILKEALQTQNESDIKKLEPFADAYRLTAKEMVALPTPKSFADFHLELINRFNNIAKEIDLMGKTFSDPAQALVGVKQYQQDSTMAYLILRNINGYFNSKQVAFAEDEPAELFKFYLK